MNNNHNNKYDPNVVIAAANAAPDLDSGRFIFQSALLEWVDDAREGGDQLLFADREQIREAVATLWLALAQYLIQSKQYKSATETLDEAVTCPVASSVGRVHAEAARFAVERGKRKTAQTIYVHALQSNGGVVTDEQDRELLWHDFLELMRETNPQLTLTALQEAVEREATTTATNNEPESSSPSKRTKRNDDDSPFEQQQHQPSSLSSSRTHVVTLDSVEQAANHNTILGEKGAPSSDPLPPLPPEIMAAWMSRDGNYPPQPPEHALFAPSPPKLSDPTAKDILGVDMAVRLVERLLTPSGSLVLEVCRGLWAWQGLWEQICGDGALDALDQTLLAQHEQLENELEARRSVAGGAADAVRQMNERERHNFQTNAQQQREQILTRNAWELRRVLCGQQLMLAQLQVPGFEEGPTVDDASLQYQSRIGQYLHSAFFIRTKMGAAPHETMLKSQLTKLKREQESGGTHSPKGGNSPLPLRHRPVSPVPPPSYNLGVSQQQQQQQSMMGMPVGGYHNGGGGGYAPPMPTLQNQPGGGLPTYMPQPPSYGGMVPPPMMMMPPPQGLPPLPGHHTLPPPPPPLPPGAHYPPPSQHQQQQQQQHYPPYYPPPR